MTRGVKKGEIRLAPAIAFVGPAAVGGWLYRRKRWDQLGNRQFCQYWPHTRAEATVFFTRMMMGPTCEPPTPTRQTFDDVPIGAGAPWYSAWVNAAYEAGITVGCEDVRFRQAGMFHPEAELLRSESACMMVNALGLNPK